MLIILNLGILGWILFLLNQKSFRSKQGGGSKPSTTIVQQPAQPPVPSPSESAENIYQARYKYDPLIARKEYELQQEFMPQQAALEAALYRQYYPEYARSQQALQRELYPEQSRILEAGASRALAGLTSPVQQQLQFGTEQSILNRLQQPETALLQSAEQRAMAGIQPTSLQQALEQQALSGLTQTGYAPEQQIAINTIRQRETQRLSRQLRERANLGGTLYGGRAEELESRGLQELGQRFAAEDIDRLIAQKQAAMQTALGVGQFGQQQQLQGLAGLLDVSARQEQIKQQALINAMVSQSQYQQAATPYMQILYPQIGTTQPQFQPFQYQSVVPSPDVLYNALYGASRRQYDTVHTPGSPSPLWGIAGQVAGGLAQGAIMKSSLRYKKNIREWVKH